MWLVDSMYVESLNINNYRNYDELFIMFDKNTNILYGDNAQEKQIYWNLFIWQLQPSPTVEVRIGKS